MATEMVKGKTIQEALKITNKAVAEALDGLPPVKMHCSNLAEEAIKAALSDYFKKNNRIEELNELSQCDGCCSSCHHDHNIEEE
jgi:nitrogen fixation NifU-like protein